MAHSPDEYRGAKMIVRFDGHKCIHSRQCVLGLPGVFIANADGPWIRPDNASPDAVAALALNCPSGAITYERLDGGGAEEPPPINVVRVRENGPLAFHGSVTIEGVGATLRATLCRCGASRHKPFCDGSHAKTDWQATGEPATQESLPLSVRGGPLKVTPRTDGPLKVEGPLEVCSGTGRMVARGTETFLCRCGGSSKKPFCDGTHRRNGFKSV